MNIIEKSESIRAGLRKGFQDGTSKMAQRRCYGYDTGPDGELVINGHGDDTGRRSPGGQRRISIAAGRTL